VVVEVELVELDVLEEVVVEMLVVVGALPTIWFLTKVRVDAEISKNLIGSW